MKKYNKILILFLLCIINIRGNGQAGVGAFAIALNQVFDRVNQLIQQFQNTGLVLETNAASQVVTVIGDAKLTYEDELKSTAQALSAQQQQLISGLSKVLDDIQNHILTDFTKNLQQVANTIPFSKTLPQLTSYSGNVINPSMSNIYLVLNGNFYDIGNNGFNAEVQIGRNSFKNYTKTTNSLTFKIPKNQLSNALGNQIQYQQLSINIPYRETTLLVLKKKKTANFLLNFVILPTIAGTYQLLTTKLVDTTITVSHSCKNRIWDSSDDDQDLVQGCPADAGWTVNVNSVTPQVISQQGSPINFGNASTLTAAQWHFKTEHHGLGTSGKLNLTLNYTESQDTKTQRLTKTGDISVIWGNETTLTYDPTATWVLVYNEFDGKVIQYSSSNNDNPYFKVTAAGNTILISTMQ